MSPKKSAIKHALLRRQIGGFPWRTNTYFFVIRDWLIFIPWIVVWKNVILFIPMAPAHAVTMYYTMCCPDAAR